MGTGLYKWLTRTAFGFCCLTAVRPLFDRIFITVGHVGPWFAAAAGTVGP